MPSNQAPKREQKEALEIMAQYFKNNTTSNEEASLALRGAIVLLQQGAKLVHIDKILFMTFIKGKGIVEFQPLYKKTTVPQLAVALKKFVPYMRAVDAQVIYTTNADPHMESALKRTGMNWESEAVELGNDATDGYYLRLI